MSKIEWCDETWNPAVGCSKVSAGCANCWAEKMAIRMSFMPNAPWEYTDVTERMPGADADGWNGRTKLVQSALDKPLRWKKPRRIAVGLMGDLFHGSRSNEDIAAIFGIMAACPQHTFLVLTKRAERMSQWFKWVEGEDGVSKQNHGGSWPLPNVHLGVSVEDQATAEERIPHLRACPAAVRWVSAEPLIGPIDFNLGRCDSHGRSEVKVDDEIGEYCAACAADGYSGELSFDHWLDLDSLNSGVGWVVVGGESGPNARPCVVDWIYDIVSDCEDASVPVFVKQLGSHRMHQGDLIIRHPKGGDMTEWPEDLRVRQLP